MNSYMNISDIVSNNPEEIYIDANHNYIVSKMNTSTIIIDNFMDTVNDPIKNPNIIKEEAILHSIDSRQVHQDIHHDNTDNKCNGKNLTESYFQSFNNELSINNAIPCVVAKDNTSYMFQGEDLKETKVEPFIDENNYSNNDSTNAQKVKDSNALLWIMIHAIKFLNNDNVKLFN
jgi:hypothetical protein